MTKNLTEYKLTLRIQTVNGWETIYKITRNSTLVIFHKLIDNAGVHASDIAEQLILNKTTDDGFLVFKGWKDTYSFKVEELND